MAWLVRGVGFVILFLARRWDCCRLVFRVRAVLGLREVGVLGFEREGIVGGGLEADGTCDWLLGGLGWGLAAGCVCRNPGVALN